MIEEIVQIILNVLINEDGEADYQYIVDESGCTEQEVRNALVYLQDAELLTKDGRDYTLIKKLRAMQIAKAAQFGIDVSDYSLYFEMEEKDLQTALNISNAADTVKRLEVVKRKPLILKRNYLVTENVDGVHENLMVIFESTNAMLYDYLEQLSKKDPQLKLFLDIHEQSESSLRTYVENKLR